MLCRAVGGCPEGSFCQAFNLRTLTLTVLHSYQAGEMKITWLGVVWTVRGLLGVQIDG